MQPRGNLPVVASRCLADARLENRHRRFADAKFKELAAHLFVEIVRLRRKSAALPVAAVVAEDLARRLSVLLADEPPAASWADDLAGEQKGDASRRAPMPAFHSEDFLTPFEKFWRDERRMRSRIRYAADHHEPTVERVFQNAAELVALNRTAVLAHESVGMEFCGETG